MQLLVISALGISLTALSIGLLHHAQYSMIMARMAHEQEQVALCMDGMASYALSEWCRDQSMHSLSSHAWLADSMGGYRSACMFEQPDAQHLMLHIQLTKPGKIHGGHYLFELVQHDHDRKICVRLKSVSY